MLATVFSVYLAVQSLGSISGSIAPPPGTAISRPIQVFLLPALYSNLWSSEVQQRQDLYWEQNKVIFAERKELFPQIARVAQQEALDFVISRMQRDRQVNAADFIRDSSGSGQFEFRNIPPGEYKIVASGTVDNIPYIWSGSIEIFGAPRNQISLKNHVP